MIDDSVGRSKSREARGVRINVMMATVKDLADGVGLDSDDEIAAATQQIGTLGSGYEAELNRIHIPEDAGHHRAGLLSLIMRIPDGWGRWISCGAGWYPLLIELHADLVTLDHDYVVEQVKEKFGALRFYASTNCADAGVRTRFDSLIADAESRSTQICEYCSAPAALRIRDGGGYSWVKTLCPDCFNPRQSSLL